MATHAVTSNANSAAVQLFKMLKQGLWELLRDIRVHFVVLVPRLLGCVDIETGTGTKVVRIVLTLDLQASCSYDQNVRDKDIIMRNVLGLVSGYTTARPFWLAPCWKKPFSEQLSPVHVKPDR